LQQKLGAGQKGERKFASLNTYYKYSLRCAGFGFGHLDGTRELALSPQNNELTPGDSELESSLVLARKDGFRMSTFSRRYVGVGNGDGVPDGPPTTEPRRQTVIINSHSS